MGPLVLVRTVSVGYMTLIKWTSYKSDDTGAQWGNTAYMYSSAAPKSSILQFRDHTSSIDSVHIVFFSVRFRPRGGALSGKVPIRLINKTKTNPLKAL